MQQTAAKDAAAHGNMINSSSNSEAKVKEYTIKIFFSKQRQVNPGLFHPWIYMFFFCLFVFRECLLMHQLTLSFLKQLQGEVEFSNALGYRLISHSEI